jgi:hypothetical protein
MHRQAIAIASFAALALYTTGCSRGDRGSVASAQPAEVGTSATEIARGKQLVNLSGCGHCHTPMEFDPKLGMPMPRMDLLLSGHPTAAPAPEAKPGAHDQAVIGPTFTSFRLPFGVVYAANLTPDRETGLGSWTAEEFIQTMRTGHHRGTGRAVLPPMPWQNLSGQPDADLRAIFGYLMSVPPISNRVPAAQVPRAVIDGISKSNTATAHLAH